MWNAGCMLLGMIFHFPDSSANTVVVFGKFQWPPLCIVPEARCSSCILCADMAGVPIVPHVELQLSSSFQAGNM